MSASVSGGNQCNVYCSENVEFKLPAQPTETKAGTSFKWGIDTSQESNKFAEVIISKSCIIRPNPRAETSTCTGAHVRYNVNNWANSAGATMEVYYEEPSGNDSFKVDNVLLAKTNTYIAPESENIDEPCAYSDCGKYENGVYKYGINRQYLQSATYTYAYPDTFAWYSNKKDGSVEQNPTNKSNNSYYFLGYGLPTSFLTPNGTYNKTIPSANGKGKLVLTISKAGDGADDGKRMNYIFKDFGELKYSCSFAIKNQLYGDDCEYDNSGNLVDGSPEYCDPTIDDVPTPNSIKDIDVVFRTVKLVGYDNSASGYANNLAAIKEAFPGRTGDSTRSRGKNWTVLTDAEGNVLKGGIKDKNGNLITSTTEAVNRSAEILDYSTTYGRNPLYKITLTSTAIDTIRKYNYDTKDHTYTAGTRRDPYSGIYLDSTLDTYGYTSYKCSANSTDNNYKYCASEFLSKMMNTVAKDGTKVLSGTCMTTDNTQTRANTHANSRGCLQSV